MQTTRLQAPLPEIRVVSAADREAGLYELFEPARRIPNSPDLLVRVIRSRSGG